MSEAERVLIVILAALAILALAMLLRRVLGGDGGAPSYGPATSPEPQ